MKKTATRTSLLALLSFVLIINSIAVVPVSASVYNVTDYPQYLPQDELEQYSPQDESDQYPQQEEPDPQYLSQQEQMELEILTGTLGEAIGMQGFEGRYAINSPDEMVEIIVQFATPPAGALQLIQERGISLGRNLPGTCYYEQALLAHDVFKQQLASIPMPFNSGDGVEIFSESYWLFNGVFMRVPGAMVESVAQLPEVYAVFPNVAFYTASSPAPAAQNSPFFVRPDLFMQYVRKYLNMDYINNEMGITGDGVVVAVIDTGIDHSHPEFARFRDHNGRIRGHGWQLSDGTIHYNTYYPYTRDNIRSGAREHGTTVSGAIIGIAPGIELWNFRVPLDNVPSVGLNLVNSLNEAYRAGAQVINMSLTSEGTTPLPSAINLAVLRGVVVVTIAGNAGSGSNPGTLNDRVAVPISITVGAGTAGGELDRQGTRDDMQPDSGRGPVSHTHHIKPDIVAPTVVVTTTFGRQYDLGAGGTSHAAPIVAGLAALLIEAFPNDNPFDIKARIMNSARPMAGAGTNTVFSIGAGFVQPLEALRSDTIVTVEHNIPPLGVPNFPVNVPGHPPIRMASLSFGGFNASNQEGTMPVFIGNRSSTARTYTISHYFKNNRNGTAHLSPSTNIITVAANSTEQLYVTMGFIGDVIRGNYEGFLYVRDGATIVARLPFAGVVTEQFHSAPDGLITTERALRTAVRNAGTRPTIIYIANDITLIEPQSPLSAIGTALIIPRGAQITLRSFGGVTHALVASGNHPTIYVEQGAQLTIDGIEVTRLSGTLGSGVTNRGHLTLLDGVISHNAASQGGGVHNFETFVMHGGEISNNRSTTAGGGGIFSATNSVFRMYNGIIRNNTTGNSNGGGILAVFNTTIILEGGEISGNTTGRDGGGIAINLSTLRNGNFHIGENVIFANNRARSSTNRPPVLNSLYYEFILGTQWTYPFTQGFNNLDIHINENV